MKEDMTISSPLTDPSQDGPLMHFGSNISTTQNTPVASGANVSSVWGIQQWSSDATINPVSVSTNSGFDSLLGTDRYSWTSSTGNSQVGVYGTTGNYTYQLTSIGGASGGGLQDTYLENIGLIPNGYTFDKQITFSANESISAVYGSTSDDTYTQLQNDFVVAYNFPGYPGYNSSQPTITGFLQEIVGSSRASGPYENYNASDQSVIYNMQNAAGNPVLNWSNNSSNLATVTIDVNSGLQSMVSYIVKSYQTGVPSSSLLDLSKWSLLGFYGGVESMAGSGATFDIQHPQISRNDSQSFDASHASQNPISITKNYVNIVNFGPSSLNEYYNGGGPNAIDINTSSGTTSISGTSGSSDTISGSSATKGSIFYTSAANSAVFINAGAANVTVFGAGGMGVESVFGTQTNQFTGRLTVTDGTGYFQGGTSGNNMISSSSKGNTTLFGGGSGDVLIANGIGDMLVGSMGASTLIGSGAQGGQNFFSSQTGASLMYGGNSIGDTFFLNTSTASAEGFVGAFVNMHTAQNAALHSLNTNVSNTLALGFSGTGPNSGTVGDFISGIDKIVLKISSTGSFSLSSGTLSESTGPISYTNLQTSNGSLITFYNTTVLKSDISFA